MLIISTTTVHVYVKCFSKPCLVKMYSLGCFSLMFVHTQLCVFFIASFDFLLSLYN